MEVKQKITKIVDNLPDEVLDDLLYYLEKNQEETTKKMRLSIHLNTLLTEDKEVLEKLAK